MHMIIQPPAQPLDQFIDVLIYYRGYTPEHTEERVVPEGTMFLIFELDGVPRSAKNNDNGEQFVVEGAWISGMQSSYLTISAVPNSEMFVVKFKPYGALPFLNHPLTKLNEKVTLAQTLFGKSIIDLRRQLKQTADDQDKLKTVERWLTTRFDPGNVPPDYLISACETMKNDPSLQFNSIANLIDSAGVSKKHFVSQFKKYTGMTPKQLQRIFRFNEILPLVQEQKKIDWSEIAQSCGYYDQAHFIKEFKTFCGMNPSDFIVNYHGSERINFFPLD